MKKKDFDKLAASIPDPAWSGEAGPRYRVRASGRQGGSQQTGQVASGICPHDRRKHSHLAKLGTRPAPPPGAGAGAASCGGQ